MPRDFAEMRRTNHEIVVAENNKITSFPGNDVRHISPEERRFVNACTSNMIAKLFSRIIIFLSLIIISFRMYRILSRDIGKEIEKKNDEEQQIISQCRKEYLENGCDSKTDLIPALRDFCDEKYDCFNSSPYGVGQSKIAVRYIAQLMNEFFEVISDKAIVGIALITIILLYFFRK